MAEESRPWAGVALGDAGPYNDDVWDDIFEVLFGSGLAPYNDRGVIRNWTNELEVTDGGANTADVDTGAALVHGKFYKHTAPVINLNIPSSSGPGNWREDLVCLHQSWAAQTTRIYRHANPGENVAGTGLATQIDGNTWEIPLAAVRIDDVGAITLITDLRDFLPNIPRPYGNAFPPNPEVGDPFYRTDEPNYYIWNGTAWVLVRRKEIQVWVKPGTGATTVRPGAGVNRYFLEEINAGEQCHFQFIVPSDFISVLSALVYYIVVGTGTWDYTVGSIAAGCGEDKDTHTDSITADGLAVTDDECECLDIAGALDPIAAGDMVGVVVECDALGGATVGILVGMLIVEYE